MITIVEPTKKYNCNKWHDDITEWEDHFKVFLAGTIDNGDSSNWQRDVITECALYHEWLDDAMDDDPSFGDFVIYNPRRDDWDANFGEEEVEKQIKWEQEKLDDADLIVMVLLPGSKSPVSMLELGLYGQTGKVAVFTTPEFYRYSNIKLTCEKYGIPMFNTVAPIDIMKYIKQIYEELY